MLDKEHFVVDAGQDVVDAMTAERNARVAKSALGYHSESLCKVQESEAARGYLGVELVQSFYGYSVRYDSGLQDWALLASSKSGELDGSLENAVEWAKKWVSADPARRYAWYRRPK